MNSSRRERRAATLSVAMAARVFLVVLESESAIISLRRGRSLVVMACSTTVLYDYVLLSSWGSLGKWSFGEGDVRCALWKGLGAWRDSSMTRP